MVMAEVGKFFLEGQEGGNLFGDVACISLYILKDCVDQRLFLVHERSVDLFKHFICIFSCLRLEEA